MQLTIHRGHFGVTPDGQWHQKIEGVGWIPIPAPEWSKKKKKPDTRVVRKLDEMRMKPPSEKHKITMVKVYKVTEKIVPDYEAEVLCRNGWQDYYPGTLRHNEAVAT